MKRVGSRLSTKRSVSTHDRVEQLANPEALENPVAWCLRLVRQYDDVAYGASEAHDVYHPVVGACVPKKASVVDLQESR